MAVVLQYGFGTIDGAYWPAALGLSLGMAAISLPFLGFAALLGPAGLGLGATLMLFLGNPLSGIAAGPAYLPDGWGDVGRLLRTRRRRDLRPTTSTGYAASVARVCSGAVRIEKWPWPGWM
ncbi:hypothetical protein ACIRQP_33920 [Streptomyces sp. NPDC102274]|uniref:hypothetical protein n=1 Tax=Streptomyces sp. NPDC102274 TaxID=3366151 RepID=UPI0037F43BAE